MKNRAVFLDRDGTINKDVGYPNSYRLIEIYPYSFEAVKKINRAGFLAIIATNQSGVGRGLIQEKNLHEIHKQMSHAFARNGAHFDGIYFCPHYLLSKLPKYQKDCSCRKPHPGMAQQAAKDFNIDLSQSYMIGDKVEDILFGQNIDAIPLLVLTGFGKNSLPKLREKRITPAHVAKNLIHAVDWILERESFLSKSKNRNHDQA